ncbi:MAG: hypothetical protein KDE48_23575 [Anaerolineales bacterium]|nr:hypothetical protein [Anaerolineales bacterium]
MNLITLMENERETIVAVAAESLSRSHLVHYEEDGLVTGRLRLERVFDITLNSIKERTLIPVIEHAHRIAEERFQAGYDLSEVQTAINVLEEALWRRVVAMIPPTELAESVGLMSTVLGTMKDELARKYVELASHQKAPSLNLSAMFKGTYGM